MFILSVMSLFTWKLKKRNCLEMIKHIVNYWIEFTLKIKCVSSVYDNKHSLIYIHLIYLPPQGYVSRQALYACATCDPETSAGVCLACCLECHEGHELFELYTKRFYYKILITNELPCDPLKTIFFCCEPVFVNTTITW